MASNYSEKEREFLEGLEDDTGRDLASWMEAIKAQSLPHRNDIIDWLRQQGFMFSKASWLERIHHNGGKPIYLDAAPVKLQIPRQSKADAEVPAPTAPEAIAAPEPETVFSPRSLSQPAAATPPPPQPPLPQSREAAPPPASPAAQDDGGDDPAALDDLIARAKAYRPLAQFVLAEITRAVPAAVTRAVGSCVVLTAHHPFGALAISPRELKLALDLGARPFDETVKPSKFAVPPPPNSTILTHMVVLTDARQVNPVLLGLIKEASERKV